MSELARTEEPTFTADGKSEALPTAPPGVEWTASSLRVIDPSMSFERVEEILGRVRLARDATAWWLGDLLRFAEARFGEKYAQAMDATGLSYGRLSNVVSTCNRIDPERRREDLSFAHHEAVAPLEPADQTQWLEAAAVSSWSTEKLREALREADALAKPPREPRSVGEAIAAAGETVDAARNLTVVKEALDLVADALSVEGDPRELVAALEQKLPEALRALDEASEPVRKAALGAELMKVAQSVVKSATVSGGFYMVPLDVFEPFKAAVTAD